MKKYFPLKIAVHAGEDTASFIVDHIGYSILRDGEKSDFFISLIHELSRAKKCIAVGMAEFTNSCNSALTVLSDARSLFRYAYKGEAKYMGSDDTHMGQTGGIRLNQENVTVHGVEVPFSKRFRGLNSEIGAKIVPNSSAGLENTLNFLLFTL